MRPTQVVFTRHSKIVTDCATILNNSSLNPKINCVVEYQTSPTLYETMLRILNRPPKNYAHQTFGVATHHLVSVDITGRLNLPSTTTTNYFFSYLITTTPLKRESYVMQVINPKTEKISFVSQRQYIVQQPSDVICVASHPYLPREGGYIQGIQCIDLLNRINTFQKCLSVRDRNSPAELYQELEKQLIIHNEAIGKLIQLPEMSELIHNFNNNKVTNSKIIDDMSTTDKQAHAIAINEFAREQQKHPISPFTGEKIMQASHPSTVHVEATLNNLANTTKRVNLGSMKGIGEQNKPLPTSKFDDVD